MQIPARTHVQMQLLWDPVTKPWESRLCLRFEAGTILKLAGFGAL